MSIIQRSKLGLSLIIAILSQGAGIAGDVRIQQAPTLYRGGGRARPRIFGPKSPNKFPPGTYGWRECARRLGGEELRTFRRADRLARGLPGSK